MHDVECWDPRCHLCSEWERWSQWGEERGKEATNGPSGVRAGDATLAL